MSEATEAGIACSGFLPSRVETPDQVAGAGAELPAPRAAVTDFPLVGEGHIGDRVFEHGDLVGADRQRRALSGKRRLEAEAAARHFRRSLARPALGGRPLPPIRNRKLHRHDV